jgi:hypothetical protein
LGFTGIHIETVRFDVRFASVDEWVGIQFAATPLAALVAEWIRGRASNCSAA